MKRCEVQKPESLPERLEYGLEICATGLDILKIC